MMAARRSLSFSENGEYLAYSSSDGTLKLWDTATGSVKQEYTPSSHLSATCSCLSWGPTRRTQGTPKRKKKRRSSTGDGSAACDLIALGTTTGSILIYSVLKGDLHTQLSGGHTDTVTGLCWSSDGGTLYSCSRDKHIIEWDLSAGTVAHKWKADRGSVNSISLCCTGRSLLSAGRAIKLWDLSTRTLLKTYSGHATEVFQLLPVPSVLADGATGGDQSDLTYFLSAAIEDRLVYAWHTNLSVKEKTPVASFSLPDEPLHMVVRLQQITQSLLLGVVTVSGQLLLFQHVLNGPLKKPLKPVSIVQLATEIRDGETPKPIPVLAAHIFDDVDCNITFAHGKILRPTFEKHKYESLNTNQCFIRRDPHESSLSIESSVSKVRTPGVSDDVTVLAPGHMAPAAPSHSSQPSAPAKRKRKKSITAETSLDERLNAISIEPSGDKLAGHPPRADTLATLLSQGLQSKDKKILNSVLQHHEEKILLNTVRRLPVTVIVPLVEELSRRMHGHAQSGQTLVKWLKTVLTVHTSYLMAFPELVESLSGIYSMMESRVALFQRMSRLQGKLDLMLSQITSQNTEEDEPMGAQAPLLMYHDESSEEDLEDDIVADNSDSEGDWDEDSDMEAETSGKVKANDESDGESESESGDEEDDDGEGAEENGMDSDAMSED